MQPYYPQPPPPPPPRSGMSTGAIVAIILVPIAVVVLAAFGLGFAGALAARASVKRAARAAAAAPLSQSYGTKNGLVVAHYPADFAAKSMDNATIVLTKDNPDGSDELVQVAAVPDPITDDVDEFGRVLEDSMRKTIEAAGDTWTPTSHTHRACFKTYPGLDVEGTFTAKGITKEKVHICFFMDGSRGYMLKTMVPENHEATDLPLLVRIWDATEMK